MGRSAVPTVTETTLADAAKKMVEKELFNKASDVSSEDGQVLLDGPDGVDVALTPEAAEETADRLIEHALNAAGQRHFKKLKDGGSD